MKDKVGLRNSLSIRSRMFSHPPPPFPAEPPSLGAALALFLSLFVPCNALGRLSPPCSTPYPRSSSANEELKATTALVNVVVNPQSICAPESHPKIAVRANSACQRHVTREGLAFVSLGSQPAWRTKRTALGVKLEAAPSAALS